MHTPLQKHTLTNLVSGGNAGTTWLYTYDQGGNIQIKAAYAYTLGAVGAVVKTDTFSYGDANWKDKLTTFNGGSISYDEIGNPLNNGTWNYSWVDGRRLRAVYKGEYNQPGHDEILFDYNEDGLRTKKTRLHYDESSGSLVYASTEYILHGKNIVHMTSNGHTMHFFYDAQNRPAVVVYDGAPYAFRYNLQGDVIALADNNGNKIVEYKYDVWGRILSTTGALAQSLGMLNPFIVAMFMMRKQGYIIYKTGTIILFGADLLTRIIILFKHSHSFVIMPFVIVPIRQYLFLIQMVRLL